MSPDTIWRHLGIDATQDGKAIRRAYAARLRAIDPDQDRDGFAALREARDLALALAAQSPQDLPRADATMGVEIMIPSASLPLTPPSLTAERGQAGDIVIPAAEEATNWQAPPLAPDCRMPGADYDAADLHLPEWTSPAIVPHPAATEMFDQSRADHALHALLYPDPDADTQGEPMTQAEVDAGAALLDRLHDEAQAGEIDLHGRIESWLSNILAGSWPRSHPLLAHAATMFGWSAKEGQIDTPPAIDYINRRLASDRFAHAVQDKGHPLHSAWKQLSKPTRPGQGRALWWQGDKIDELIATIRRDYPELEQRLNWHRIAIWESRKETPRSTKGAIFMVVVVIQLIAAVARCVGDKAPDNSRYSPIVPETSTGSPQPPLSVTPHTPGGLGDLDADLKAAMQASFGPDVTLDSLRRDVPLVYQLFESNWRIGLDLGRSRAQYRDTMEGLIRERYGLLARQAGGKPLVTYQRQRLKDERHLKGEHWQACATIAANGRLGDVALIPADQREAARPVIASVILSLPDNPKPLPATGSTFSIPGPIVEKTMAASGLTLERVQATFRGEGSDREKCLSHIALLDAALEADAKTRDGLLPHL
ncbi:hypothetical protein [Sphingobium sp. WCS2017Hpa-17]|uniref:hypothetical protein n=1 Tax=Sphingobium sp. WCS2017Hpa-17 TaxID=3073638 RepID=UPI00288A9B65|nr:hypothetical protein [Sphingobium sp. WCS2017Hpa-17]